MLILSVLLLLTSISFGLVPKELKEFFNRSGYVIQREDGKVILDLGKGKVFPGERFLVERKGKPLIHPITNQIVGYKSEETGKVEVLSVEENFSEARVLEDKGIKAGDSVKLLVKSVCFVGSEEGFYALSETIPNLKKGEDCEYVVRELREGYGVSYLGKPIAFFGRLVAEVPQRGISFEDFALKAKLVRSLEAIPLGADVCPLFGGEKDYLIVLFSDYLKVYEILRSELVEVLKYSLPSGEPVGVQCFIPEKGKPGILFVNILSGGNANSAILKPLGNSLVVAQKNIPYIFNVLDKDNPKESLYGQEFNKNKLWGEVYRFVYKNGEIVRGERANFPEGFRIDGAAKKGNILVFIDNLRRLRVYVGNAEVLSEDGFGASYTTATILGTYDYDQGRYSFFVKPAFTEILKNTLPLVARNRANTLLEFLNFTKFVQGELWTVVRKEENYYKPVSIRGRKFEDAIQAIVKDREGRIYVITGTKGTIPIQNRGEIFLVEINPL